MKKIYSYIICTWFGKLSFADKIALIALIVAVVAILVTFIVPEGRELLGLDPPPNPPPTFPVQPQIAFTSDRNGNREIYIMRFDNNGPKRMTEIQLMMTFPVGRRMVQNWFLLLIVKITGISIH